LVAAHPELHRAGHRARTHFGQAAVQDSRCVLVQATRGRKITVERIAPTDWIVVYQEKKYMVLTDEHGCLLSATMPDYA